MIIECNVILFTWKIIKTNYSSQCGREKLRCKFVGLANDAAIHHKLVNWSKRTWYILIDTFAQLFSFTLLFIIFIIAEWKRKMWVMLIRDLQIDINFVLYLHSLFVHVFRSYPLTLDLEWLFRSLPLLLLFNHHCIRTRAKMNIFRMEIMIKIFLPLFFRKI